jgi:chloramphenicol-sensitive protein RarD
LNLSSASSRRPKTLIGIVCGISSYLIWGLSPLYWKLLSAVPAFEIILHRIVWSFLFLVPLFIFLRRGHEIVATFQNPRTMLTLLFSALLVAFNWLLYVWAVNHDQVLQASLGYYIAPLVNVILGMLFLKERLRRAQAIAFLLAFVGVLYLTLHHGRFPWISLSLAFSFGLYGLIRKTIFTGALAGLSIETLLLSIPAASWLFYLNLSGAGVFLHAPIHMDLLLMCAALTTALPLLLFTVGVRRLKLSTMGFLQYLSPTCMFLLGVFIFGEPFSKAHAITFILIWSALAIYSLDSARIYGGRS